MSKSVIFPYGITLRKDGAFDTFPAAEVGFLTKENEWLTLFLLIDSGATVSALPKDDASVFDISLKEGKRIDIVGVSGESLMGWQHEITVRLGKEKRKIPIVFLNSQNAPRILGRVGVFPDYTIVFEENKKRTGLIDATTNAAKAVSKTIDGLK